MADAAFPLRDYLQLTRLDRPVGIWLLLWPTLWALWWAAEGWPPGSVLAVFVLGTVLMRSAGCAINDVADRKVDPQVWRTADRPIAAGRLSARQGVMAAALLAGIAFILLLTLQRPATVAWSVPAVLLAAIYPLMKRFIDMPQAVLGLAFSWGIPMAWSAVQGVVPMSPVLLLMAANIAWVIGYDTYYAMADRDDDARIGVRSSARWFGRHDRAAVLALKLLALGLLAVAGRNAALGPIYFVSLAVAAGLVAQGHWATRSRDPQACLAAFKRSHWQGAVIWIGLVLAWAERGL